MSIFPPDAPFGLRYKEKCSEILIPHLGFLHLLQNLLEKSQFLERYVKFGRMEAGLNRRVLFGPGEVRSIEQLLDVLGAFDYANPKNDKKPLLDWLKNTFLPILEKMKKVTSTILDEVDVYVNEHSKKYKTLADIIQECEKCCSEATSGSAEAASAGPESDSD
jgi:hypothetical protein